MWIYMRRGVGVDGEGLVARKRNNKLRIDYLGGPQDKGNCVARLIGWDGSKDEEKKRKRISWW